MKLPSQFWILAAVACLWGSCGSAFAWTKTLTITSEPAGAHVTINGLERGPTPATVTKFSIKSSETVKIEVRLDGYETQRQELSYAEMKAASDAMAFPFKLLEVRRSLPLELKVNLPDAKVSLDGVELPLKGEPDPARSGVFDYKHTVTFSRESGNAAWPGHTLRIWRVGYHYEDNSGSNPQEAFTKNLTADGWQGTLSVTDFKPVTFWSIPISTYVLGAAGVKTVRSNVLSQVDTSDATRPIQITSQSTLDQGLVISRMSAMPNDPDQFVFVAPIRENNVGSGAVGTSEAQVIGANLWLWRGQSGSKTPLTTGKQFDLDPCITSDGKFVYFSSERLNSRASIWRISTAGSGAITKITGNLNTVDMEPAVAAISEGADISKPMLAYTSRPVDAPATVPSFIWTATLDGRLPTQICAGRSPAWKPDGTKIAFVSPENKLWVMSTDGSHPTQLTQGDAFDCDPVWTTESAGARIVFASNRALNDRKRHNFDIWIMNEDGSGLMQLTQNGSFDGNPATVSDGSKNFVYFLSNRGAQSANKELLHVFRMELAR